MYHILALLPASVNRNCDLFLCLYAPNCDLFFLRYDANYIFQLLIIGRFNKQCYIFRYLHFFVSKPKNIASVKKCEQIIIVNKTEINLAIISSQQTAICLFHYPEIYSCDYFSITHNPCQKMLSEIY